MILRMTKNLDPVPGDLRVWWIPQIPGKPFHISVATESEAILVMNTLADYDLFQFENHIKPDYSNAGGLEIYDVDDLEWVEWYDEDGYEIDWARA